MEGSREGAHGNRFPEEFQDESGLELCLGLGLCSADSRQKWKTSEGFTSRSSPPSINQTGEPAAAGIMNGIHPFGKSKPSTKASCLDAALKRFLEGHVDEQDENGKLLDGGLTPLKDKEKSMSASFQDKPGHQVDVASDMDNKGKPFLFKDLQVSSGQSTSGGPSPARLSPLPLVDVFKIGSNSSSSHSGEGLGQVDGDNEGQEISEQHQKLQEAHKKRKYAFEEQKIQKKSKKDDRTGTHGFRMPGNNTWVNASALDMDKAVLALRGDDASEQIHGETSHESGDGVRGYETDGNDSTSFDKNASADMGANNSRGTGDDSKGVEVSLMPQFRAPDTGKKLLARGEDDPWSLTMCTHVAAVNVQSQGREMPLKGVAPNNQKDRQVSALAVGREADKAGSPLQKQVEKVPSETSSDSTDGTEKLEEKARGGVGETTSSAAEVLGSDKVAPVSAAPCFFSSAVMTSSAPHPYPLSPYPVVPMPYPLSGSMPLAPVGSSSFHPLVGIEYPPPQMSSLEGTSWMQALRPPVVSPFTNASNGALYSRNAIGVADDANNRLQVTRAHENGNGNGSLTGDMASFQNYPVFRTAIHNSTTDSQQHQGLDAALHSSIRLPAVPHFTSQLALPEHGELRALKEGGMPSFPGFTAQSVPGSARPPSSSGTKEDGGQEQGRFGGKTELTHPRSTMEPSNLSQEEFRRAIGGHFNQGRTDNLSIGDGLSAEDLAHLQRGIAPGLKFGGSGTPPDLPWVYATGPSGRAVGGVLYKLGGSQLRVVCACHGKHMSPAEFHLHAGDTDSGNAEKKVVGNSSPLPSQAT